MSISVQNNQFQIDLEICDTSRLHNSQKSNEHLINVGLKTISRETFLNELESKRKEFCSLKFEFTKQKEWHKVRQAESQ